MTMTTAKTIITTTMTSTTKVEEMMATGSFRVTSAYRPSIEENPIQALNSMETTNATLDNHVNSFDQVYDKDDDGIDGDKDIDQADNNFIAPRSGPQNNNEQHKCEEDQKNASRATLFSNIPNLVLLVTFSNRWSHPFLMSF